MSVSISSCLFFQLLFHSLLTFLLFRVALPGKTTALEASRNTDYLHFGFPGITCYICHGVIGSSLVFFLQIISHVNTSSFLYLGDQGSQVFQNHVCGRTALIARNSLLAMRQTRNSDL